MLLQLLTSLLVALHQDRQTRLATKLRLRVDDGRAAPAASVRQRQRVALAKRHGDFGTSVIKRITLFRRVLAATGHTKIHLSAAVVYINTSINARQKRVT